MASGMRIGASSLPLSRLRASQSDELRSYTLGLPYDQRLI